MDSIKLWARKGEAMRQAIEVGEIAHIETASEELTDEFLLVAIESGLLKSWAESFPDPRGEPEIAMEVILPAHIAARFAGLYSMRKAGYVLRSARVLGALGYSVEVVEPARGLSLRGTADDTCTISRCVVPCSKQPPCYALAICSSKIGALSMGRR